eukprot:5928116-Pyramimonas_sp.AAC.1
MEERLAAQKIAHRRAPRTSSRSRRQSGRRANAAPWPASPTGWAEGPSAGSWRAARSRGQ